MQCETVKVVSPVSEGNPLGFIVINKSDLTNEHELFEARRQPVAARIDLDTALASLPGEYTDAEYVVTQMRAHFGDLFTADDESKVRSLVKEKDRNPSDGLNVEQLKAALTEKGIEIPDGAKKADLQVLVDAASKG
ncbi:HeH/LEM domain-containing protein [Cupriavidus basilensis]|uniref:HeH/LEM domain-containing protein n=1 Tax=Cupriavidus basilensis TaxID=68895 RepID=UPI0039F6FEB5